MNEDELKAKWESEKPLYNAWGKYIVKTVTEALEDKGKNLDEFLKVPAKFRLKDDKSFIDKALYRPDKNYTDPYNEIEDKVGVRFIVLLVSDIEELKNTIEENEEWSFTVCKHFEKDREKDPLLFTYQSVHCILRSKNEIVFEGIKIPTSTPCEVQIRTLLQHAHAELTHDAIYKSKRAVQPRVHRTVAKSMALIETTDDFFMNVTELLNYGPLEEHNILERLDGLYLSKTSIKSHTQKSSIIIWDVFEQFIDVHLVSKIQAMLNENDFLAQLIKKRYSESAIYQQSTVLFVYWMLRKHKRRLLSDWPFSRGILETLASDFGINIWDE
jgi:ppGpp synthetase/RelA/SpoT-type nucleotidyltranferase